VHGGSRVDSVGTSTSPELYRALAAPRGAARRARRGAVLITATPVIPRSIQTGVHSSLIS